MRRLTQLNPQIDFIPVLLISMTLYSLVCVGGTSDSFDNTEEGTNGNVCIYHQQYLIIPLVLIVLYEYYDISHPTIFYDP